MSCIVYQTDHKTGAKYAYESVSYWDKEKQQPRSKRKYLGKVDPETGEIISKKNRVSHSADDGGHDKADTIKKLSEQLSQKDDEINALRQEIKQLNKKYDKLAKSMVSIGAIAAGAISE